MGSAGVYLDEAGNTGTNFLDIAQPVYVAAGWCVPEEVADRARITVAEARLDAGMKELKGSQLLRTKIGRDRAGAILDQMLGLGCLPVFNAMDGLAGVTQPLILPGETFTYEFTVRNAGSHMYHSHMNATVQVPGGLLGAFIVDGGNEPAVAQDDVMILNDGPLGYTLNGKGFPATHPIVAKPGEVVRIRYMNEGLQIHPMHLHGLVQTVCAVDGNPVPQRYQQDTVLVAPGQRVDVLVTASELGAWAFHCHILSHAENEQGMFGMVTVFIVK